MIKKIDISDASIAEEIRKQMSVATVNDKGLVSREYAIVKYPTYKPFDCNGQEYNTKVSCFLLINGPIGLSGYKYIETEGYSADWMMQKLINVNSDIVEIYVRVFHSGKTWSSWKKMY